MDPRLKNENETAPPPPASTTHARARARLERIRIAASQFRRSATASSEVGSIAWALSELFGVVEEMLGDSHE